MNNTVYINSTTTDISMENESFIFDDLEKKSFKYQDTESIRKFSRGFFTPFRTYSEFKNDLDISEGQNLSLFVGAKGLSNRRARK